MLLSLLPQREGFTTLASYRSYTGNEGRLGLQAVVLEEGRHCDESVDVIGGPVRERACEAGHSANELGEPLVIAA